MTISTQETRVERRCPVCAGTTAQTLAHTVNGFRVFRCDACGLGATEIQPSFDTTAYYDAGYFHGARSDGYADYTESEGSLRAEFRRDVTLLRRFLSPGARLLEIGCAYGFFLLEARAQFRCTGLDVSTDAIASARARGLDAHAELLTESFIERQKPFDAIVMLDVIEHLDDPERMLELVKKALVPGGVLLLTTGDWGSPTARVFGARWRLMTPPQHLFFYSRKNLRDLLARSGFAVAISDRPWKRVPVGLALYQLSRRLGLRLPIPQTLHRVTVPVNLFDTVRVLARRSPSPSLPAPSLPRVAVAH